MCAPGAPRDPSAVCWVRATSLTLLGRDLTSTVLPVTDGTEAAEGHAAGSLAQVEAAARPVMAVAVVPFITVNL